MIDIVEVSPRDGLQSDALTLSTEVKLDLIERLIAAGAKRIEATSFVNPKRVPQMADADELMARLPRPASVSYSGLVLNRRGLDRALAAGIDEVNFVVVATDTFNRRNQGAETAETLAVWADVAAAARSAGRKVSAVIGAAFGCPFEGEVPVARLVEVVKRIAAAAPDEVSLADTIGVAAPSDVTERFAAVASAAPGVKLRGHFHNTRNTGLANAYAALQAGVSALDASLGGIGGCPFAPAATGNIPTEDLCYMLNRMGASTGFDLKRLIEAARWLESELGRPMPAMLGKAGLFPRESAAV
jgi:hydroxymethylglutaryl-CoA lyase